MSKSINLTLNAGSHCRHDTPMTIDLGAATKGQSQARLVEVDTGREIPCQLARGHLSFILPGLGAREERKYMVEFGVEALHQGGVRLSDAGEKGLVVGINGLPFTTYRYLPKGEYPIVARPFFYPVLGPGGAGMTRNYPMRTDVAGEQQDHPHHRGLYVAFGDVNGTDNWSEEKGHGFQSHQRFLEVTSGPVFGRFTELLYWESVDRRKLCEEVRVFTAWDLPPDGRVIDLSVSFIATEGPLKFGDTKEGGIVAIRIPTTMDANKGGTIENAAGGIGEAETWGKSAHWVDCNGPSQNQHVGVAIMDHPFNLRHPTPWHVRDYGLFAANPFGQSHYKAGLQQRGDHAVGSGSELAFRYRIYFHRGDAKRGDVSAKWNDYAFPPAAKKMD